MKKFKFKENHQAQESAHANGEYADFALAAIDAYNGTDRADCIEGNAGDLIAALGHLCDREGLDFEAILDTGKMHWLHERE